MVVKRSREARKSGLGAAFFLDEVEATLARIEKRPKLYPEVHLDVRRANLHCFPHSIFYFVYQQRFGVLAIHHNARDPERWKQRRPS